MAKIKKAMKGGSKVTKKGKKGKESEKERLLRFEIERMKEEEAQRNREEKMRQDLKEGQLREERYSRVNRLKIQNQWRKLMRLVKVEELRKEIEIISQNHEREVDRKDALIQMYDRDLEEAEEQYQMALRSHLQVVDSLIDLHYQRTKSLEIEFEKDLQELMDEFFAERTQINAAHAEKKKDIMDTMQLMEREFQDAETDMKQQFDLDREDIKNKNSEEYNVLKFMLESSIEDLERHFDTAHQNYMMNTEQRTHDFKNLTFKDQKSAGLIEAQMRKLQRLQDLLLIWKMKISNNQRECDERNSALKGEKESISRHFQELKARMNKFREQEAKRLQQLTINSNAAIKKLKERLEMAEKILKLSELNRKLETEREKVLPFYQSSVDEEDRTKSEAADMRDQLGLTAHATGRDGKPVEEWAYLDNFFKRYNKVLLDEMAISREKMRLDDENADLRSILKQYLDGISVNEDVMNHLNPLLVVNHRTNIAVPAAHGGGGMPGGPVVEAAHVVQISQLEGGRQGASF